MHMSSTLFSLSLSHMHEQICYACSKTRQLFQTVSLDASLGPVYGAWVFKYHVGGWFHSRVNQFNSCVVQCSNTSELF